MAINIRKFGKVLNNIMYGDTCTISRLESTEDEYGATKPNGRKEIFKDIACKFSFSNIDQPDDNNETYAPVLKQVKVITDLDHNIMSGDFIEGYRTDETSGIKQLVKGICGEPNRYDYHQEIIIQLEEDS